MSSYLPLILVKSYRGGTQFELCCFCCSNSLGRDIFFVALYTAAKGCWEGIELVSCVSSPIQRQQICVAPLLNFHFS
ncbi:hypothetical protein RchiOBHm_Chr4g0414201 [Rosa chinensis]|uniref:Uncharacterized protein n=1 Tax=Rosa chinensis TaxID=74649 RepID=A0A2P6QWD0_ROSCH|nr:hypothetical protein RchiOBHm_Chr4g0414201 [Rosa chinensis]